ncbi:type II toxin-antitoxin system HicB family antitoxin [Klebsiella variicola]|uniref:type II toxin-antitoxin system HicB family antitoxin n=1 Tax=Klebsiella variicola TaxID=244366 RepID=UPI001CDB16CF|nr:type II toxin-antitoxin system HicB family antitoxin [Klebsiella variicola]
MDKMLKYKGYFGSVETSLDDMVLHGKIECIADLITYEADSLPGLKNAFEEAVDDYLETCSEIGKNPDKPMSGTFNVRIGEILHKQVYIASKNQGVNLNEFIKRAIEEKLAAKKEIHFHFERKTEFVSETIDFSKEFRRSGNWELAVGKGFRH